MRFPLTTRWQFLFTILFVCMCVVWTNDDRRAVADDADLLHPHSVFFDDTDTSQVGDKAVDSSNGDATDIDDLRERLQTMEDAWSEHQKELEKADDDAACKPTFEIHGRIHADYWSFPHTSRGIGFFEHSDPTKANYGTDPEDLFAFRRVRLEMEGDILESMLWRIQVDFNNPQTPEIKDVYIGFDELPYNQSLLIGHHKRPLGLDHLNSSKDNVFLERPFVVDALNEDNRRMGIAMHGHKDDESFGWAYGAFLLEPIGTDGRYRGDDYQPSLNARLFGSPWYEECTDGADYWHWGIAGMLAFPDGDRTASATNQNEARFRTRPEARSANRWFNTGSIAGAHTYETLGLETMFNSGPLLITGEYQFNWTQRDNIGGSDLFFHGGYLFAAYMLTGEHIPYDRKTGIIGRLQPHRNFFYVDRSCAKCGHGWGAWQLGLRYSYLDLTDADITGGVGHSGTLALNWFFNAYAKLQFNLIYGTIDERGPIGGFDSGNYLTAGTRLAIEF